MKSPQQQAHDEVKKIINEQRVNSAGGVMSVAKALDMCEEIGRMCWVRGYSKAKEDKGAH